MSASITILYSSKHYTLKLKHIHLFHHWRITGGLFIIARVVVAAAIVIVAVFLAIPTEAERHRHCDNAAKVRREVQCELVRKVKEEVRAQLALFLSLTLSLSHMFLTSFFY